MYVMAFILSFFEFLTLFSTPTSLLADYDIRCDRMKCHHASIDIKKEHQKYFLKKVPLVVHQIWFGNFRSCPSEKTKNWEDYCNLFDYKYKKWSEKDLVAIKTFMNPKNFYLFTQMLNQKNWWAASDILRYELLYHFGGIYVDCDFNPPNKEKAFINFKELIPMQGITFVTENMARNIKETALFVCNGIIISCPHHPVLESAMRQVYCNAENYYLKTNTYDAMFATGPFLLNKILWGSFNILTINYVKELNMY